MCGVRDVPDLVKASNGNPHHFFSIQLEGVLKNRVEHEGKTLLLGFADCRVWRGDETFFDPSWGTFDLALGQKIKSVYGGAADRGTYLRETGGDSAIATRPKCNLTEENRTLNELYAQVRAMRERPASSNRLGHELETIHAELEKSHPMDWLLRIELLELAGAAGIQAPWIQQARARLERIAASAIDKRDMIRRGLELL